MGEKYAAEIEIESCRKDIRGWISCGGAQKRRFHPSFLRHFEIADYSIESAVSARGEREKLALAVRRSLVPKTFAIPHHAC